jgi:hypothetical protein
VRLPNGEHAQPRHCAPNTTEALVVPIDRAGQNIVEITAAERPGEITAINNRDLGGYRRHSRPFAGVADIRRTASR